tara:strand:- start:45 stop:239 length:195 start_codon:yes stop_codon:yes gene_type:complete
MKIKELIDKLSSFDSDGNITFYFLKNNTLTNCQLEDIDFYSESMGVEVTIQDTADKLNEKGAEL